MSFMNIPQKMDEHKAKLVEQDKERAIEALVEYIHYEIASRALRNGHELNAVEIFGSRNDLDGFCQSRRIREYALEWVMDGLSRDGLGQEGEGGAYRLTENGVRRYCASK